VLLLLVLLIFRRGTPDVRQAQLPDQVARLDARGEAFDGYARAAMAQMREDIAVEARRSRDTGAADFSLLRGEVSTSIDTLGAALRNGLALFRADHAASTERLQTAVREELAAIGQRLGGFMADAGRQEREAREALHLRLQELGAGHAAQQEKLRAVVEERLERISATNAAKLEEMRITVDEKLHATLQTRLTESFGQVTTHLGAVQKGLGEMKELATGVGDLKKVLTNVKSRGTVGEFQLGMQLEQMFSPEQYLKNARIKPDTLECVEYALKFPNGDGQSHVLLPIDAKFPKEDWERLEHAYDHGGPDEIATAGRAFERSIRAEGKRICEKYIDPPTTMPHAIMFLPTENLYAEVVRRPGLQADIQSSYRVTIAGPATFMAILTSFQMGFHTIAIEKKGDEVWRVLSSAKGEFEKFGVLMDSVRRQVDTVQSTLGRIGGKTKTINRSLRNVASIGGDAGLEVPRNDRSEQISAIAPLLAAVADDD
jgi:DNA recombination protein RmuC